MKYILLSLFLLCGNLSSSHFLLNEIWIAESKPVSLVSFNAIGTVYWGVSSQTDDSPNKTASQKIFDPQNPPRYVALSRDIEANYNLSFGDSLFIEGHPDINGWWIFEDRMNKRWCNKIDFLMPPGYMNKFEVKITAKCDVCTETNYKKINP